MGEREDFTLSESAAWHSSPWQKWSFSASVADAWKEGLRLCFEEDRTQSMAAALPSPPRRPETLPERFFEPLEDLFRRPQAPRRPRSELLTQYERQVEAADVNQQPL